MSPPHTGLDMGRPPLAATSPHRTGRCLNFVDRDVGADDTPDREDVVFEWASPALSFRRGHAGHDGGRLGAHPAATPGSTRAGR
jgi:hypothetical protein